ncbi:MAG TPA: hypothetical protein ENN51_00405 [candidate division WOR-3 bacterium]|uniref:ThuA-like domain-containing protein n=1 Tax=candidate division WOR-3 bacterium TaxID=2052148 RepID=A0A7V0XEM6_UNCW3|nr:hypothetical protein [candidate division WOR-3 bacterium]
MNRPAFLLLVLLLVGVGTARPGESAPTAGESVKVMIAYSDPLCAPDALEQGLADLGYDVYVVPSQTSQPSKEEMLEHAAVIVASSAGFHRPTTLGDDLADYVDDGGFVIIHNLCFTTNNLPQLLGRVMTQSDMRTLQRGMEVMSLNGATAAGWDETHPITQGLGGNLTTIRRYTRSTAYPEATVLATLAGEYDFVALSGNRRVVAINTMATEHVPAPHARWAQLVHQAIQFGLGSSGIAEPDRPPTAGSRLTLAAVAVRGRVLNYTLGLPEPASVRLSLWDRQGRMLDAWQVAAAGGITRWTRSLPPLSAGVYFVSTEPAGPGRAATAKFALLND